MTVCYNNCFVLISDIISILKETPKEYELSYLLADINDKWYDIGLSLLVPRNVLNRRKRSGDSNHTKLSKVISFWITNQPSPVTWERVITGLESPFVNNKEKADLIRHYVSTGKNSKSLLCYVIRLLIRMFRPVKYI